MCVCEHERKARLLLPVSVCVCACESIRKEGWRDAGTEPVSERGREAARERIDRKAKEDQDAAAAASLLLL